MKGILCLVLVFSLILSSDAYKGSLFHELDVAVPASSAWEVYGTLRLAELAVSLIPDGTKVQVEQGDGGVGTVLLVIFPSGSPGPSYRKEKFVTVDNVRRLKEVATIEGGMLEYGFSSYLNRFEIIKKTSNSCTIRSTTNYEIDEEHIANVSYASIAPLAGLANAVAEYLLKNKNSVVKGIMVNELDAPLTASEVWEVYRSFLMGEISVGLIPGAKLVVLEGDGGVGTVILAIQPSGEYQKEKFIKIDDKERVKEVELLEGGFMNLGFTSFIFRFEIIEKTVDSCTIKSSMIYEIPEEKAASIADIDTDHLAKLAEIIVNYILDHKSKYLDFVM